MAQVAPPVRSNLGAAYAHPSTRAIVQESMRDMSPHENPNNGEIESNPAKLRAKESKYHLWPAMHPAVERQTSSASSPNPDADKPAPQHTTLPNSPNGEAGARKCSSTSPKHKTKPSSQKRRKPSVTDLGPMTTVQEVSIDSPTIPGRPPLHERSASAPGTAGYGISRTTVNSGKAARNTPWPVVIGAVVKRKSLSPVNLSRLVIPSEDMGSSTTELRYQCDQPGLDEESDEGTPPLPPPKSPWMEERATPMKRCPTAPANMSAPCRSNGQPQTQTQHQLQQTPSQTHVDGIPMTAPEERGYPRPWATPTRSQSPSGHLRQMSEGGIMERGRPTQRLIEPISRQQSAANSVGTTASADLPSGVRASEVPAAWSGSDIATLQEQAREQAADFRILAAKDVQSISRELRSLDERCEYLRRTLNSLRMGRRGLHTRMVAYLKSPRMAKFSRESMLKQEEALGELDGSIDDWVAKLDRAESRRTRIRQKLLEHVAATLSLKPVEANVDGQSSSEDAAIKPEAAEPSQDAAREPAPGPTVESTLGPTTYSPDFNKACPTGSSSGRDSQETAVGDDDTPPRTPERPSTPERFDRRAVESIKIYAEPDVYPIYADADVYALLEDVEQEISNMTDACEGNHEGVSEPWISSFAKTPMI